VSGPGIELFRYGATDVRTVAIDGEPWFVAADVCAILEIGRVHDAVRGLDDDEKGAESIRTLGGEQSVSVINEPGLYSLILRSRKPEAKAFKRWITHEVLPAIRRTGGYVAPMTDDEKLVALAQGVLEMRRERDEAVDQRDTAVAALESAVPAIEYHERYVTSTDVVTVKDWGAQFGLTDPKARALLVEKGIVYRKSIGHRWSQSAERMVEEFEYRARAGRVTFEWFDLRPQHSAPRHLNGQVRSTLYVRQQYALDLGRKVGLRQLPSTDAAGAA
jgi:prophage antirepressor-like protein